MLPRELLKKRNCKQLPNNKQLAEKQKISLACVQKCQELNRLQHRIKKNHVTSPLLFILCKIMHFEVPIIKAILFNGLIRIYMHFNYFFFPSCEI